jgi:hypothetical protein
LPLPIKINDAQDYKRNHGKATKASADEEAHNARIDPIAATRDAPPKIDKSQAKGAPVE